MRFHRARQALRVFCLALLASAMGAGSALAQSDPGTTLTVPLYGQQTNVWCWDASSLMVIKYFRPWSTLTQCQIATQGTAGQQCCASPVPTPCVHGGWEMLSSNGFTFSSTNGTSLSFSDLTKEIAAKRPVEYAIGWSGGGGHMLVADGWFVLNGIEYVSVNDPWPPTSGTKEQQTYDYWVGGSYYDHVTWADFYNIVDTQPKPNPHPTIHFPIPHITMFPIQKIQAAHLPPGPDPLQRFTVAPLATQRTATTLAQLRSAPLSLVNRLGFASAAEVAGAQLGTPLREYTVPLDKISAYTTKAPASSVMTGGTTLFYPLVVNGKVRSSMRIMSRVGVEPKVLSLGDIGTATHIAQIESINAMAIKRSDASIPAVRVPALGLYFVGKTVDGKLQIASIFDVSWLHLKQGEFADADAVFARIAPFASKMKGTM